MLNKDNTIAHKKDVLMVLKRKGFKKDWAGNKMQGKGKKVFCRNVEAPKAKTKVKSKPNAYTVMR